MLSDDKRALIEAEERYRQEVNKKLRSDLAATEKDIINLKKDFWSKISDVLNSNFGLWLLSSVFLSGGAALYQITQHHYEVKLSKDKEIIACEFEIANRLNSMRFLLRRASTVAEAKYALTPITKSLGAVSAEYENVNIAVLYFKRYQLTGMKNSHMGDYVRELEEKNLEINRGDLAEYNFSGEQKRYYEVESANNVTDETKKSIGGFKPYWKQIVCVPVKEDVTPFLNQTKGFAK